MTTLFRIVRVIVLSLFSFKKFELLDETWMGFTSLPLDMDFNWHLNNGNYLKMMDFARTLHTFRIKNLISIGRKNKWKTVVSGIEINFLRSLRVFTDYRVYTRFAAWDDRTIYVKQKFMVKDKIYATALVKTVVVGPKGRVSPYEVFEKLGYKDIQSPPLEPLLRSETN